jgi:hypothetical protein
MHGATISRTRHGDVKEIRILSGHGMEPEKSSHHKPSLEPRLSAGTSNACKSVLDAVCDHVIKHGWYAWPPAYKHEMASSIQE